MVVDTVQYYRSWQEIWEVATVRPCQSLGFSWIMMGWGGFVELMETEYLRRASGKGKDKEAWGSTCI